MRTLWEMEKNTYETRKKWNIENCAINFFLGRNLSFFSSFCCNLSFTVTTVTTVTTVCDNNNCHKKSLIRETVNLLPNSDSRTDTILERLIDFTPKFFLWRSCVDFLLIGCVIFCVERLHDFFCVERLHYFSHSEGCTIFFGEVAWFFVWRVVIIFCWIFLV